MIKFVYVTLNGILQFDGFPVSWEYFIKWLDKKKLKQSDKIELEVEE